MKAPIFTGVIDKGRLVLDQPQKYLVQLSALNGEKIELVIRKKRNPRSMRQNSFYWGVVIEILADHLGYTPEEMHAALKIHFLRFRSEQSPLISVKSTTALSAEEFNEYVNQIVMWAAKDLNVYIPDPHQVEFGG